VLAIHTRRLSDRVLVVWPGDHAQTTTMIAIASEQGIVVVDTESSWSVTAEIRDVIAREFQRDDFAFVINTHGHTDHGGGNQVFDDAVIVAHDRCPGLLRSALHADNLDGFIERRRLRLDGLVQRLGSVPANDPEAASIDEQVRYLRQIVADLESGFQLTVSKVTFSQRLTLNLGDLTVRMYYFGGLHSKDHIVVHVPEEALLVTGDILTDSWIPTLSEGDDVDVPSMLAHWDTILQRDEELHHIVNGHWDLDLSLAYFRQAQRYVRTLWQEVRVGRSQGLDLAALYDRLQLRDRFPAFREVTYEYEGTDYHHRNIELIWSLLGNGPPKTSSSAAAAPRGKAP
jgi:glyoxylase-like metal-dependent hydrolase (beta-lactamase superfamily II)